MNDQSEPSAEGRHRYPRTGGYVEWDNGPDRGGIEKIPCTCNYTCLRGCNGRCGCEACSLAFTVYADQRGWVGPAPRHVHGWMMRAYGRMFPPTRPYRAGHLHKRRKGEPKLQRRSLSRRAAPPPQVVGASGKKGG